MPFELRVDRTTVATFDTEEETLAQARALVQRDANAQPEVLDANTGRSVGPAASAGGRDDLARKIGY